MLLSTTKNQKYPSYGFNVWSNQITYIRHVKNYKQLLLITSWYNYCIFIDIVVSITLITDSP